MTDFELAQWLYNHVKNTQSRPAAVNSFIGAREGIDSNGFDGVMVAACREANNAINDSYQVNGGNPVAAFNDATAASWPNKARAYLAKYELLEGNTYDDAEYEDDLREFVEVSQIDTDWEPEEVELDGLSYAENPYEEAFHSEQIDTTMVLRLAGEDLSSFDIQEVEYHSQFLDWVERLGDAEEALRYHTINPSVDDGVIEAIAPVDEWPDELDAHDMDETSCACCVATYMKIYNEDRGICHINDSGSFVDVVTDTAAAGFHSVNSDGSLSDVDSLCESCSTVSETNRTAVIADGNDVYHAHQISVSVIKSDGAELESADRDMRQWILGETRGGVPDDVITMSPGTGPSSTVSQRQALDELLENPEEVPDGIAVSGIEHFGDLEATISFRADNVDAARIAKEILEEPDTVTA